MTDELPPPQVGTGANSQVPPAATPGIDGLRTGTWLAVFGLFLALSLIRAPIPAVNEPHYLGKARYWWNPDWCSRDFFLQSSNPHAVYYFACGWVTRWLSLSDTAFVLRVVQYLVLAWGWCRLAERLLPPGLAVVASAAIYTALLALGSFSGEWLLGGAESKIIAYGLLLGSAALFLEGRLLAGACLAGACVSFHPVVGIWYTAVLTGTALWNLWRPVGAPVPRLQRLQAALWLTLWSLPGLIPALAIVVGVDGDTARQADRIVIAQRLGHHIDPLIFPASAYQRFAMLLLVTGALGLTKHQGTADVLIRRALIGTLLVADVGLIVGWLPEMADVERLAPWRLVLLKFYPFRLADAAVPWFIGLYSTALLTHWLHDYRRELWFCALGGLAVGGGLMAALVPSPDANASRMTPEVRSDWILTCHWLRDHTPRDALVATANEAWAVKWFADRAEYVSFKDCPQDAAGILEWRRRWLYLESWSRTAKADDVISAVDLARLHRETGINYLVVSRYGPLETAPVHMQGPFRVYRLGD